jgi:hypothetical protein
VAFLSVLTKRITNRVDFRLGMRGEGFFLAGGPAGDFDGLLSTVAFCLAGCATGVFDGSLSTVMRETDPCASSYQVVADSSPPRYCCYPPCLLSISCASRATLAADSF